MDNKDFYIEEKTIMDITGTTRDERVASNMLAFYFNPNEEHEFGNLILKAFINVLIDKKLITDYNYENISIIRELKTLKGKWIDIVIKNNDCVIGIENKIDASLYNDLDDYSRTLDSICSNAIKIVLSIHNVDVDSELTGFVNIKYEEFFESLDKILKENEVKKDDKWYIYLDDFVTNYRENHIEHIMRSQFDGENFDDSVIKQYNPEIERKIKEFTNIINSKKNDRKKVNSIFEKNLDLTAFIYLNGFNMDARLVANANGWSIGLNVYRHSKLFDIKDFLNNNKIKVENESNQHLWLKHFGYNEDINKVADYYIEIYNLVKDL